MYTLAGTERWFKAYSILDHWGAIPRRMERQPEARCGARVCLLQSLLAHAHKQLHKKARCSSCCAYTLTGKGTVIYKNGDKYEGDWASDVRHGLGTLWIYKDGKYKVRYNGEWRDDVPWVSCAR